MCGIVGYIGDKEASPILIKGLKKLEYRGYDSAGIAVFDKDNNISVIKTKGRLIALEEKVNQQEIAFGSCGIGHTRWATHGEPSDVNSHPHMSKSGEIAVVHNGIIENYMKLKEYLQKKGYEFLSETDTEVIAHLFDYYYTGDLVDAVIKVISRVRGSYALGVICKDNPDELLAVRKDSPLIVGLGEGENYIASDIPAVLEYTRKYYLIGDNEVARLTKNGVTVYNTDKEVLKKEIFSVTWDTAAAEKGGYEHFMLKEMMEQPKAVKDTISPRIDKNNQIVFEDLKLTEDMIQNINRIHIVACGSAWHVGVVGKYVLEHFTRIPVEVDLASEFRYRSPILDTRDLCIVISQSGETADTLAALREAKRNGVHILSIVNVVGSSITRESDDVLYTWAGPEIAVATTKAYSTQLVLMYLIALYFSKIRGRLNDEQTAYHVKSILTLPSKIESMLTFKKNIQYMASKFYNAKDIFFIGRGVDYALGLEGSLKLKEISYIHSEAYAAGELKHGTISLIEPGTLVVALATQDDLFEKVVSNIKELKARGATVIAVAKEGNRDIENVADHCIYIPEVIDLFSPSLGVIPMQLLAYYIAVARGCDVDKPRNLAKSVTVE
jgi:glucosamine--fructose-6-phosphate aminotransferase (isomerizing)